MNGVDILAMEEVAVEFAFNWTWFWIVFSVFATAGLIWGIYEVVAKGEEWIAIPIMTTFFILFGVTFGYLFGVGFETPTKYETQYKVVVSDEVSMTEFLEKYEIIDTEGKIYTVREK
jgi:predicted membrane protein